MIARCARCQGTFTTDHYGRQTCPHCGSELILADPGAPPPPQPPAESPAPPPGTPAPSPEAGTGPVWGAPPAPPLPPTGGEGAPPAGGWVPPSQPAAPPPPPELAAPFAERGGRNWFVAYFTTWKLALVEPQKFFAHVRVNQTGAALLFALCSFVVVSLIQALMSVAYLSQMDAVFRQMGGALPPEAAEILRSLAHMGPAFALIGLVGGLALDFVLLFTAAGVIHLLLLLFRGAGRGFEATLTVVAYSCGLALLSLVPCGAFVVLVWQPIVLSIGLAAAHRTTMGKAVAAVLTPAVLFLCCCCLGGSMMAASLKELLPHDGGGTTL